MRVATNAHRFELGAKFGAWTIVGTRVGHKWPCVCACGKNSLVDGRALKSGKTKSCGCVRRPRVIHGASAGKRLGAKYQPAYGCWIAMRRRCERSYAPNYKYYGGRGIRVCERWQSFVNFFADMGERPSSGHSLERIDNDGNYEPGNVRWATLSEQCRNRRSTVIVEHQGRKQCVSAWCQELGVLRSTLYKRMRSGQTLTQALFGARTEAA